MSRKAVTRFLLLGSAAATLALGASYSGSAAAQACSPSSPSSGATVTCAGSGAGIQDTSLDDATITVEDGADVNGGSGRAFRFRDGVTITNDGTIRSDSQHAIQGGANATIINNGTITGGASDDDGINLGSNALVTNNGAITGSDEGVQVGDNGMVENNGSVTGGDKGVQVGNNSSVENSGTITGNDHGVSGANGVTVVNTGTITGEAGDGVNIDDNGRVENSGTISGGDDGVQVEANGTVINYATGIITANGEGINANQPNAYIENHGIIEAGDDGINAGVDAYIINTGRITSTGDQDGIDLDSGTIINSGLIESLRAEDGIDFDPSTDASLVINSGIIRGNIAINTDDADTGAQTVINSGTLIGFGGTALNLGMGDDTLILDKGSRIVGLIEMGGGDDTLIVNYVRLERLHVGSAIETVATAGPSFVGTSAIILLDPVALGAGDRDAQDLAFNMSRTVLTAPGGNGLWTAGRGASLGDGDRTYLGGVVGYDIDLGGHALGVFGGGAKAGDLQAWLAGLRFDLADGGPFDFQATAFAGVTDGDDLAGSDGADGTLLGFAARASYTVLQASPGGFGLDLAAEGGLSRHAVDGYTMSDLDTSIGDRDSDAGYARIEIGLPYSFDADTTLRGFAHVTHHAGSADLIAASFEGQSMAFASGADLDRTAFGLGASFTRKTASGMTFDANIEASHADGETDVAFGLTLRMPLGN
ncbi:MAG: beta strand repeat-containing protein [Mesorhizobium sp.]